MVVILGYIAVGILGESTMSYTTYFVSATFSHWPLQEFKKDQVEVFFWSLTHNVDKKLDILAFAADFKQSFSICLASPLSSGKGLGSLQDKYLSSDFLNSDFVLQQGIPEINSEWGFLMPGVTSA